ncbi:protein SPEAR3 isoform X2 [Phoenix dactylifera]|uniref:Protein SPEAR3 isoform X2 n=1 Tax=Phoenix dactylifera TaxID=42345 RepID=A0A8B9AJQ6_PHODC|nr:protein SPEAR3 isoform X2 [Phoenix dactylifera]
MGSSHYGELYLGNGRSGSSRRGKKSNTDKPKQPQRGLGVAQLEKIRLYNQMMAGYLPSLHPPFHTNLTKEDARHMGFPSSPHASSIATTSSLFGVHPNTMMIFGGSDRTDIKFGDHYADAASSNYMMPPHHFVQPAVTLPLLTQTMEMIQHDRCHSLGSVSQNSDSSDSKELDLELKLSL